MADKHEIKFLRGTQTNYDGIASKSSDAFYVTTDTHRLYLGTELLSQAVVTVANAAALPNAHKAGQIYYVQDVNALAIWDSVLNDWTQVNPDDYYRIRSASLDVSANKDGSLNVIDGARIKSVLKQYKNESTDTDADDTIQSSNIIIKGNNTYGTGVSVASGEIVVSGTNYDLARTSNAGEIELQVSGSRKNASGNAVASAGKIKLIGKDGGHVTVENGSNAGEILLSARDTVLNNVNPSKNAISVDSNGKITVHVEDTNSNEVESYITPVIKLGTNSDEHKFVSGTATLPVYTKTEIDNKIRGLDAMEYIGTVNSDNSLKFLPEVGGVTEERKFHVGDTFKVSAAWDSTATSQFPVVADRTLKANDIIIARGTETDGEITWANVVFDVVHCGDASDTTYALTPTFSNNTATISLDTTSGSNAGLVKLVGDNECIDLDSVDISGGKKFTVNHQLMATRKTTHKYGTAEETEDDKKWYSTATLVDDSSKDIIGSASTSVTQTDGVITGIVLDKYGHIVDVKASDITLVDTAMTELTVDSTVTAGTNAATIKLATTIKDTNHADAITAFNDDASFTISGSENIKVATSGTNVSISLEWGEF